MMHETMLAIGAGTVEVPAIVIGRGVGAGVSGAVPAGFPGTVVCRLVATGVGAGVLGIMTADFVGTADIVVYLPCVMAIELVATGVVATDVVWCREERI